jgi:hypothetical protein
MTRVVTTKINVVATRAHPQVRVVFVGFPPERTAETVATTTSAASTSP